jgi:hypothetical protein
MMNRYYSVAQIATRETGVVWIRYKWGIASRNMIREYGVAKIVTQETDGGMKWNNKQGIMKKYGMRTKKGKKWRQ